MIYEDAIYDVLTTAIDGGNPVLAGTEIYKNLRSDVDQTPLKMVRVSILSGKFNFQNETKREMQNCRVLIQCYAKPLTNKFEDLVEAEETSFAMVKEIVRILHDDPTLDNAVCISFFNEFEKGLTNVIGSDYGTTYLFGTIN